MKYGWVWNRCRQENSVCKIINISFINRFFSAGIAQVCSFWWGSIYSSGMKILCLRLEFIDISIITIISFVVSVLFCLINHNLQFWLAVGAFILFFSRINLALLYELQREEICKTVAYFHASSLVYLRKEKKREAKVKRERKNETLEHMFT